MLALADDVGVGAALALVAEGGVGAYAAHPFFGLHCSWYFAWIEFG